jgi:hypothetical protein
MKYLIWSVKWKCWYRDESKGYTTNPEVAGRFGEEEAIQTCKNTHGECKYYPEESPFIEDGTIAYLSSKKRELWTAMQTMTPAQAEKIVTELVQDRKNLMDKRGI